jgi:hypothetical protein
MQKIKHLSKAAHNEDFFNNFNLDDTRFRDWVVVALFYSLLHYYEAYFAINNKHSKTHDISDDWIANDDKISATYLDYRDLKQERWNASYWSKIFSAKDIRDSILPKFNNIKSHLSRLF